MNCRELIEYLSEYIDGGLDPHTRARFDEHLAECEDCAAYLDSYRAMLRMLKFSRHDNSSLTSATIPTSLRAVILAARSVD